MKIKILVQMEHFVKENFIKIYKNQNLTASQNLFKSYKYLYITYVRI